MESQAQSHDQLEILDIVSSSLAAFAALLGVSAVVYAASISRKHLQEYRLQKQAEYRPYVVVRLFVEAPFVGLELANLGRVAAKSIKVVFVPPLESTFIPETTSTPFGVEISYLAPSETRRMLTGGFKPAGREDARPSGRYEILIDYCSDGALPNAVDDSRYSYTQIVDFAELFPPHTTVSPYQVKHLDTLASELKEIRMGLKTLNSNIERLAPKSPDTDTSQIADSGG